VNAAGPWLVTALFAVLGIRRRRIKLAASDAAAARPRGARLRGV